ncbi:MAG: ABC transporter ATP-binding protein [Acidimicrobiia bacterium]|nr:ABC transporter ATP-binding protein [Acidimicrobiia bacterium]
MSDPLLQFQDVSKSYHRGTEEIHALRHVSCTIEDGEFVVVTGPSGSGKSTLLHVAAGLDKPDGGKVTFRGTDVFQFGSRKRARFRRRNIGFVFQFFNLVPTLNAVQNVSLPMLLDGIGKTEADKRAEDLLVQLGMESRLHHKPNEMSGGQMQRVAVARALIADPPVILADEPTGNLDSEAGAEVLAVLKDAAANRGAAVVLVTHDPEAAQIGDRRIAIHDGNILAAV